MNQKYVTLILLSIIILLGAFLRLWQLDKIPPGLYPDEAINGNDALNNPGKVFYPENNGREGLFHNLLALSFKVFGPSLWALRAVSAFIGILTILGIYFLTKELFTGEKMALLSSFFLAVSFWHINFSRIGFRAILLPLILTFCFYFLLKGLRTKTLRDIIIAGIIFGLGFYTYISFRLSVFILPFIFIPYLIFYRRQGELKQFWLFALWFLAALAVVALPIAVYFISHPQDFISRASGISIFVQNNPLAAFAESLAKHLGMFNIAGDPNWRHNIAGAPMLFWPLGILFIIGFVLSLIKASKLSNVIPKVARGAAPAGGATAKVSNNQRLSFRNFVYIFLISWFLIMLLPGVLTYEGLPHALRVIGIIPAVIIMAALGGVELYKFFEKFTFQKTLLKISAATWLLLIAAGGYYQYFALWGQSQEVKGAFSQNFVKMGQYLNSLAPDIKKYVIVNENGVPVPFPNGIPMPAQTLIFIENTAVYRPPEEKATYLKPGELEKIKPEGKTIILPMKEDPEIFAKLLAAFPEGKIQREKEFFVYVIGQN